MRIVGLDAATTPRKTGLAWGRAVGDGVALEGALLPRSTEELIQRLVELLDGPALLAIDAPLGWPQAAGRALAAHRAGEVLQAEKDPFFRRLTDDDVAARFKKRPLEVGANFIARTAFVTLEVLARVRASRPLPLAWAPGPGVIEVYPAATLRALQVEHRGYKQDRSIRERLLQTLPVRDADATVLDTDHVFDAMLCVLAGAHFLAGRCPPAPDTERVRTEGWIWVAEPA